MGEALLAAAALGQEALKVSRPSLREHLLRIVLRTYLRSTLNHLRVRRG